MQTGPDALLGNLYGLKLESNGKELHEYVGERHRFEMCGQARDSRAGETQFT